MKNYRGGFPAVSSWVTVVLSLGLALAFAAAAQASPQYTMDCSSCHYMPPMDSKSPRQTKKDPATGAVPGNHETHADAAAASCVVCHGPVITSNSHRNKAIELVDGFGYTRKVGGFLNQTSVPPNPLGTCSTTSCHSDGKGNFRATPAWGSNPYSGDAACGECHGVAPATGNHPTGGDKHAQYYGTGLDSCKKCHSEHRDDGKPFAHATSSRAVEVKFELTGSFTLAGSTCSGVYCHSDGRGTAKVVTWGGGAIDCSGCHGSATAGSALSGKHAKHVNNNARLGTSYGCVECHANTVLSDSAIGAGEKLANHVNAWINYSGANAGSYATGCSTVYCHSDGKGRMIALAADEWANGAPMTDCKGCHGSDPAPDFTASSAGEPNYLSGPAGSDTANSHKQHVGAAGAATCVYCHSTTTLNGSTVLGATHTDRNIQVQWGGGKPFDIVGKTCSNINCHTGGAIIAAAPAAVWGATLNCAGCHADAAALNTGSHRAHLDISSMQCDACHSATASDNSTLVALGPHMNDNVLVTGARLTSYDVNKDCATSCHLSATPRWNVASTGACGTCHAALSNDPGPLKLITLGAHQAHFTNQYGPKLSTTATASCDQCHTPATALSHADGVMNLNATSSLNGLCGDCHKQSTNWTGAASCQSCHSGALSVIGGVTAPDKGRDQVSGHGAFSTPCASCHDGSSDHISGALGDNNRILGGLTGDAQCNSCHQDSLKVTARTLNMQGHVGASTACEACHDAHGTRNSFMVLSSMGGRSVSYSGADYVNPQGTGVCQACHVSTGYYKAGEGLEASHPTTGCLTSECHPHNAASGTAFEPTRNCDSCHGYPPVPRNLAGFTFGIQDNWSSAKFEDYSGGGGAHVVNAHVPKTAKASEGWANCTMCHVEGAAAHAKAMPIKSHIETVSVKIDPQYRLADDMFMAYTTAKLVTGANATGTCFNVSCHFRTTTPWSTEK